MHHRKLSIFLERCKCSRAGARHLEAKCENRLIKSEFDIEPSFAVPLLEPEDMGCS